MPSVSVLFAITLASVPHVSQAAYLTTTNNVGGNTGWNTAGIWKTNGTGTGVSVPVAGNTYACVPNGIAFGNGANNTRMRNLYATTSTNFQTFPGDSLTMSTNTEFRCKQIAAGNVPTLNFPGVNGNPGLLLDGGVLNIGDDCVVTITGNVQVVSQSFIAPGDNGGGSILRTLRGFIISANLSGSGDLVIFQSTTNTPQTISGVSNTFTGQWFLKAGRLVASTVNSLGTNNITLDPYYVLPSYFSTTAPVVDIPGPAVLDVRYDLNSAGVLTLVNGGMMNLHQNVVFRGVTVEGTPLSAGTHYYAELAANYPANFMPNGSGSITVQAFGPLPVLFVTQPQPEKVYAGATVHFTALANSGTTITYQWLKNGAPLSNGGNITGSTNTTLTISNVSAGDTANYSLRATSGSSSTTSSTAALSLVTATETYEIAVASANPVAFYQLNDIANSALGTALALDNAGGFNGTYGTAAQNGFNGIAGPRAADGFAGFASGNSAAQFVSLTPASHVSVLPWHLNTNAVTITAWINPMAPQPINTGLVYCRGGTTTAGLAYSSVTDPNTGSPVLGYNWNNEWETWNWVSGITPPSGQWSFVALVVTPTNVTIHLMNTNGLVSATRVYNHAIQAFDGTTMIGDDSLAGDGTRTFNGAMDDVAVFNRALSKDDLLGLYSAAAGSVNYAPIIASQPAFTQLLYVGQTAQFTVVSGGTAPLSFQWQTGPNGGPYVPLTDGGSISGSTTATLTISNVQNANAAAYVVTVTNPYGSTNSNEGTLAVVATSPALNITMSVQQGSGFDWNTGTNWSDLNPASLSAVMEAGSTYEVLAGARMRTPQNPRNAIFPGNILTLDGDSVRNVSPGTGATIGEIRCKQPNPGTVYFPKLVMNGGQFDVGNDGMVVLDGEIDVLTNAPFNNDGGNDRGYRIDAKLTGNGSIEYWGYVQTAFMTNYANNLNIANANNTFTGKWKVVYGTLLATGANALGTNDISIGTNGALQTTYDLNNPNGSLYLNGRMYLNQNDTFNAVFVGGAALTQGTYTLAQLAATYPAYFPTNWTPQTGATSYTNASGSIVVLSTPVPTIVQSPTPLSLYPSQTAQFTVTAAGTPPLFYQWRKDTVNLTDIGNISGSMTPNLILTNIAAGDAASYDVVVTNSLGSVTSIVATLTVLPIGSPENITLNYGGTPIQQPIGTDWNTTTNWSDGNSPSVSALANPGSTYEVVPGARLRSPAGSANATFAGDMLTVDGDGVWVNPSGPTIGEIRLKWAPNGIVHIKKLVMNGGELDSATDASGSGVIAGEMDILANTPLYNDSGSDRGFRIDGWLTGTANIEYRGYTGTAFNPGYAESLNITGKTNTFSGTWNVVQGVLLGSALNSLGTNTITVTTNGALETLYDIYNPNADLVLDGQVFLHQHDTFRNVIIGGMPLAPGTYTFAQLSVTYTNFPGAWFPQTGSTFSSGFGSITVLGSTPPPVTMNLQFSGSSLQLTWSQGTLLESTNVMGPWTTNSSPSPFTVSPTEACKFYRVQTQ